MISDSRARRENLTKNFTCEKCNFKSGSETLVKRHNQKEHRTVTITKTYISKRLNCEYCSKKFNKMTTFQKHMEKVHDEINSKEIDNVQASIKNQNDLPSQIYEEQTRVTRLRKNKTLQRPWNPNN